MLVPLIATYYLSLFPEKDDEVVVAKKSGKKTGFFEGLRLMVSHPYVMGVFVVVTFYEIMSTIVEYQMGWLAAGFYTGEEFSVFKAYQGIGINVLALIFALLGTSFFMRRFGLRFCLSIFPVAIGVVMLTTLGLWFAGVSNFFLMWFLLGASVVIKGLNYALNKPTGEVMYIPTSKDIKFKTKGWIDSFGNRSTKGMGSAVSKTFSYSFPALLFYGTILSFGILGIWFLVARYVGTRFNKLQETDTIIE